jgi:Ser/Thr protein kinase RdoA (MazF antagonist)
MNNVFPDLLPADITSLYGQTPSAVTSVTQVQNRVYRFRDTDGERILRLTPESHREGKQVAAEIAWVRHLAESSVAVAVPIAARDGRYWHRADINGTGFTVAAFTFAPGEIGSRPWWTPEVFHQWGRLTGKLHQKTRDYLPTTDQRPDWTVLVPHFAPETHDEEIAFLRLQAAVTQLQSLPRTSDAFGLIHADLHFWNFAVEHGKLTVFDFDNSEYNWFVADIGTAVFEAATCAYRQGPRAEFIRMFLGSFLDGYRKENDLGRWLEYLPLFVKLREISIFLILGRRWRWRKLGEFQQSFFANLREGVLNDLPFLET